MAMMNINTFEGKAVAHPMPALRASGRGPQSVLPRQRLRVAGAAGYRTGGQAMAMAASAARMA